MKKTMKKLRLNRETLRALEAPGLRAAQAGLYAAPTEPIDKPIWKTNEISICIYCTTPLDTCPDPTIA